MEFHYARILRMYRMLMSLNTAISKIYEPSTSSNANTHGTVILVES